MSSSRLRLFSYPKCGTCRKALQWLDQQGFSVGNGNLELIDITLNPPGPDDLRLAFNSLGRKRLFNTSGQSYRALGAAAVAALSDDEALAALAADGKLIKRPFAITEAGTALVGFKPEEWQAALG
ncbi:MAG: Spx/MgsR family RNA polymerase-binding regulatory protein [Synechococcaceae bacterium WB7_3xG_012]|uniref:Spx/MgsR family RNA polymerase-binding regulatory protein n=1 Tax=Synechococcus sp. NB0720_010 TaxID=2907159 RepID=UPI001FF74DDA|nr:Spx/MgsR family RNA polymerase-binding regulatory protein [Synechococcus sp. NB0720_010]NCV92554.1 Spx/MgsR family RNA polymerase-binding regulatory protein [Synechococcaceae bacterium WB7_3xG_012]UPH90221.1 Spx/MgsR family RNA polymerase-binding regulatory protein [Synechococcus sp. NB0720_010]